MAFTLAFYEVDRQYGGSEEGGWWFASGTLERTFKVVKNENEAYRLCRRANDLLRLFQDKNRRIRPVSSVAYSGGRFACEVYDGAVPAFYPEERPRYE